jgi:hypothetical protein
VDWKPAPVFCYSNIQIFKHFSIQTCKCSGIQTLTFKYSNNSDIQTVRSIQTCARSKHLNIQKVCQSDNLRIYIH